MGVVKLKTTDREQRIISILDSRGEMSVKELSLILNISISNLRKQLSDMQDRKLIIRTYGGVMSVNPVPDETFDSKSHKNVNEKRLIAAKARTLVKSGDSISLGSGTTVLFLSNLLYDLSATEIYTNSMQAAEHLAHFLNTHICGGIIRSATGTIIGDEAFRFFRNIHVDCAFISCDAIDDDGIVYSDNLSVATVENSILQTAKKKYILCDSTKFGKKSIARIADLSECTAVITGSESLCVMENLKNRGIDIIFADV
jgi:DeoR/GlpR family transcriptional regulator of sugar metabolism